MIVTAGSTNVSVYYYIVQDASGTSPGEPVTGLLFSDIETGGSASYARQGAARTDLTLITLASASAAHSDGGFILVDDTNMPGLYRCDYPDSAFATGVDQVFCSIVVASANNAVAAPILVDITDVDLRDSVRAGMTALPNAAADAAGGLVISDAGGYDIDANIAQTGDSFARLGAPAGASVSADVADVPTVAEFNARTLVAASYFDPAADTVATVTTLTNKTGFSLASTGLDAIASTATGMVEIAKAIWDRVLSGATHNINNSAGKRLRLIDAAFEVHSGTAQAGSTSTTFVMDAGASATDDIYNGDRIVVTGGTGAEEHGIIINYVGSTRTATMSKAWVITPDATSEFTVSPADCDIETWNNITVTGDGDWNAMQTDLDTITGAGGVLLDSTATSAQLVDDVWDEVITKAAHNVAQSAAKQLRNLASSTIRSDTAQGPGTGPNQIQLDTGASAVDGSYDPSLISIISGTGLGQSRNILQYDGSTRTATVDRNWKVAPDATSEFTIIGNAGREHVNEGLAQSGGASTITLNALASASDDVYNGQRVFIRSGTGEDQAKLILDYNGTTKIATVESPWAANPDSTSAYVLLPNSPVALSPLTQTTIDAILTDTGTIIPNQITALNDFNPATEEVQADVNKINGVVITGDGSATPFDV